MTPSPEHSGCDHAWDDHVFVAPNQDPMQGGVILCPASGCPCFSTWGVGQNSERPTPLPPEMVAELREMVQNP